MLNALLMAEMVAFSGIKGAKRRKTQMSRPGSATALRRRTQRLVRGASGSARPASQPALLGGPAHLEGSSPRRQRRLVKIFAIVVTLLRAYSFLCKHCNCDILQVIPESYLKEGPLRLLRSRPLG